MRKKKTTSLKTFLNHTIFKCVFAIFSGIDVLQKNFLSRKIGREAYQKIWTLRAFLSSFRKTWTYLIHKSASCMFRTLTMLFLIFSDRYSKSSNPISLRCLLDSIVTKVVSRNLQLSGNKNWINWKKKTIY